MNNTLLARARGSFNDATSGNFRGRDSFCKLLNTMSDLSLAGFNRDSRETYAALNTTKQKFEDLQRSAYRQAARENYQDSTAERFAGSGRPVHEALFDLHFVPVYMEKGGLDPKREESWAECGINHADYIALYNTHRIAEACRLWNLTKNPDRSMKSNCNVLGIVLGLLTEAGLDVTEEETYNHLQTTKQDFDSFFDRQRQPAFNFGRDFAYS